MLQNINLDTIFSDPMLLMATVLLVLGPLVFLFALIKFILTRSTPAPLPPMEDIEIEEAPSRTSAPVEIEEEATFPSPPPPPVQTAPTPTPPPPPPVQAAPPPPPPVPQQLPSMAASEKTVVMPAGMGEFQGQMEIAFSQIKNLNKKVFQMESELESLSRLASSKLEKNELKEIPMNPSEFTQKLLKLAEHVIVLEKEVAKLKAETVVPAPPKPPVMPI